MLPEYDCRNDHRSPDTESAEKGTLGKLYQLCMGILNTEAVDDHCRNNNIHEEICDIFAPPYRHFLCSEQYVACKHIQEHHDSLSEYYQSHFHILRCLNPFLFSCSNTKFILQ